MNNTPIDWSKVIVGKTWLESPNGCLCRVDGVIGDDVWVYYPAMKNCPPHHLSWTKHSIASCKWKIREEWEDITEKCSIVWWTGSANIAYGGGVIFQSEGYKFVGMKVYKRRGV